MPEASYSYGYLQKGLFYTEGKFWYSDESTGVLNTKAGFFSVPDKYNEGKQIWYYGSGDGSLKTGWVEDNGKKYYVNPSICTGQIHVDDKVYVTDADGAIPTDRGWFEFTDQYGYTEWYYGNGDGSVKTGWLEENGKKYYLRPSLATGRYDVDGKTYLADDNGAVYTKSGWFQAKLYSSTAWYYGNGDGSVKTGWLEENGKKYYLAPALNTGEFRAPDQTTGEYKHYVADQNGAVYTNTGWFKVAKSNGATNWYYGNGDGSVKTGWLEENGKKYYFETYSGRMCEGQAFISDSTGNTSHSYYFDPNSGAMMTGWQLPSEEDVWHYYDSDGTGHDGWTSDKKYYLHNGRMLVGDWFIDGKEYDFNINGTLKESKAFRNGWNSVDGEWYYFENGNLVKDDWKALDGSWYRFDYYGRMESDQFSYVDGKRYYFTSSGKMAHNGWFKVGDTYCYANSDGSLRTGWQSIGGVWYYFCKQTGSKIPCAMVNQPSIIDGKYQNFDSSGAWKGNITPKNGWYSANDIDNGDRTIVNWMYYENGTPASGWRLIGSKWYYFAKYNNYYLAVGDGLFKIKDKVYLFDDNCQLVTNGWYKWSDEKASYADSDGVVQTGWVKDHGSWYYLEDEITYYYGEVARINGTYNVFDENGRWIQQIDAPKNSWLQAGSYWCYFKNGSPYTGWVEEGEKSYYIYLGVMRKDEFLTMDYRSSDSDHSCLDLSNSVYGYLKPDGTKAKYENVSVGGQTVYVGGDGALLTKGSAVRNKRFKRRSSMWDVNIRKVK